MQRIFHTLTGTCKLEDETAAAEDLRLALLLRFGMEEGKVRCR